MFFKSKRHNPMECFSSSHLGVSRKFEMSFMHGQLLFMGLKVAHVTV